MTQLKVIVSFCVIGLLLHACATGPNVTLTDEIGPPPGHRAYGTEGTLQVFTRTVPFNDGGTVFYPHSEYRIYKADGSVVRYVRNHTTKWDQRPEQVKLPPGRYYLIGLSEGSGVVRVPFLVKGSQHTSITLDGTRIRAAQYAPPEQTVRLPDGSVAGFKSAE